MLAVSIGVTAPAQAAASGPAGSMEGTVHVDHCSWDHPGGDPFMGNVVDALDRYTDMPADVRARLQQKMAARQYDDIASITRDRISGKERYDPEIREMHFGTNRVCRTVSRARWSEAQQERGLVYCDKAECIIVPTVCRNVSRVTRRGGGQPLAAGDLFPPAGAAPGGDELMFAAPSAGPAGAPGAPDSIGDLGGVPGPMASAGIFGGGLPWLLGPLSGAGTGAGADGSPGMPAPPFVTGGGGMSGTGGISVVAPSVPEPGTWLLLSLGLAGLAIRACSKSADGDR